MTIATVITLLRFALIPLFAYFCLAYGTSVESGSPDESLRWFAIATYTTASLLDGLDGWVARHFDQQSPLGAMLDPIADKALLMTGLLTATFVNWGVDWHLPTWFIVLVIARDLEILIGILVLYRLNGRVPIAPHWIGKVCTVTQMIAIGWIMLKLTAIPLIIPTLIAAVFTLWSAYAYYRMGYHQLPGKSRPLESAETP